MENECFIKILSHSGMVNIRRRIDAIGEWLSQSPKREYPMLEDIFYILQKYQVSDGVIRHSVTVAEAAVNLAIWLNESGIEMSTPMLAAAGLLHDIAKGTPAHAKQGAKIIGELGYPAIAAMIATHMDLTILKHEALNEGAILYFADKLSRQNQIVSLEERFNASLEKYDGSLEVMASIKKRFMAAWIIQNKILTVVDGKLVTINSAEAYALWNVIKINGQEAGDVHYYESVYI
ncbi:MAG: mobA 1 [Firmicutes bacterium]|nr:mobA 1 [Bacillota bacterium]